MYHLGEEEDMEVCWAATHGYSGHYPDVEAEQQR